MSELPHSPSESFKRRNPGLFGMPVSPPSGSGSEDEIALHNEIIAFCRKQYPNWKYTHANPAVKSTIAKGHHDLTIFFSQGRMLCIECKSKTGKLDADQTIWAKEMSMLGHTVHVVRSMEEFLKLL